MHPHPNNRHTILLQGKTDKVIELTLQSAINIIDIQVFKQPPTIISEPKQSHKYHTLMGPPALYRDQDKLINVSHK